MGEIGPGLAELFQKTHFLGRAKKNKGKKQQYALKLTYRQITIKN